MQSPSKINGSVSTDITTVRAPINANRDSASYKNSVFNIDDPAQPRVISSEIPEEEETNLKPTDGDDEYDEVAVGDLDKTQDTLYNKDAAGSMMMMEESSSLQEYLGSLFASSLPVHYVIAEIEKHFDLQEEQGEVKIRECKI